MEEQLAGSYSPEQIAGRARLEGVALRLCSAHLPARLAGEEKGGKRYLHLRTQGKRGAGKESRGLLGRAGKH